MVGYSPCQGREARFLQRSHRESNPGPSGGSPLVHYTTAAPCKLHMYTGIVKHRCYKKIILQQLKINI